MLVILSPAKKLDYDSLLTTQEHSLYPFIKESQELIDILKKQSVQDIKALMKISDALAELNLARYQAWTPEFNLTNARQAIFAFDGDVYDGLQAKTLDNASLSWANEHLAILSGLYGVLKPLDLMQPYRLEMGTSLQTSKGKTLYDFWGDKITNYLNTLLEKQPLLVNLASQEYFKSVNTEKIKAPIIQCVFQDFKNGQYKIISFNAKRARGLMARFIIDHRIEQIDDLKEFNVAGYEYCKEASSPQTLVFRKT
ncbi:peroxide stress protein YaaA [Basilea psittacipulmonis]|uniref:UPF0246 protein IX83_01840 n=1 Tax=Basilea psittacipulmonis DSM 24701 TaxID=1072685 RepID=A0A077DC50_9BURK|nr:peroxide stress protein YaaA [Basilea psittacipulmonis]AIL32219.1 hypothetical protein IX83_01840 [Basilea psittacipulmonis DSM 24701]